MKRINMDDMANPVQMTSPSDTALDAEQPKKVKPSAKEGAPAPQAGLVSTMRDPNTGELKTIGGE
jgi:hypothetical protein